MIDTTGKIYEQLVQVVWQSIINQSQDHNLVVLHDVTLQGKHVSHQIDVYWKFEIDQLVYETVVQAKDWEDSVTQGELIKFKGVLEDLPGQPKGIVVTRGGFQKGARDYALAHGILLYELREADNLPALVLTTTGWARLRTIPVPLRGVIATSEEEAKAQNVCALGFDYDVFTPDFSSIKVDVSTSWFRSQYPTTDVSELNKLSPPSAFLSEIHLYDHEGATVGNLAAVFKQLAMNMNEEGVKQKRATHAFEPAVFLRTTSPLIPYVKADAVSVDVKINYRREIRRGRNASVAQWILHNLNSNNTDWFAVTPSVTALLPSKKTG